MQGSCLIFLHIPKTAGSTFHMILNARYKKKAIRNVFGSRYSEPEIKAFIEESAGDKQAIKLLKGHMPFGLHTYLPQRAKYISILRDPVERVISQYYYIKKNVNNPLHEQVEQGGMSLTEFVESGISIGMNNGQCRFINGDIDEYGFNDCDDVLLQKVKQHLVEHFIWIGLTERFDESVLLLSKILNWPSPPYYIRENVSKIRKTTNEISDASIDTIKHYNRLDIALYEYANQWLNEEIAKITGFHDDLARYREYNRVIQERWGWLPDNLKKFVI